MLNFSAKKQKRYRLRKQLCSGADESLMRCTPEVVKFEIFLPWTHSHSNVGFDWKGSAKAAFSSFQCPTVQEAGAVVTL
jgi:hypothetical protein